MFRALMVPWVESLAPLGTALLLVGVADAAFLHYTGLRYGSGLEQRHAIILTAAFAGVAAVLWWWVSVAL